MTLWQAVVLGIVQGATEFLPVSSSGHLVIFERVMGVAQSGVVFEVAVHLATLLSILLVYRTRTLDLLRGAARGDRASLRYVGLLCVATVPAALVGVLWTDVVEALFDAPAVVGVALLITGTFLWSSRAVVESAERPLPGWGAALVIGLAQTCALVPGISRSGATVVAALWLGVERREAAAFSFLMAVPAIAGAAVLQIPELSGLTGTGWTAMAVGSLAAAVTGVLAIRTFVAMLGRGSFHLFAPYCWAVGLLFLLYLGLR